MPIRIDLYVVVVLCIKFLSTYVNIWQKCDHLLQCGKITKFSEINMEYNIYQPLCTVIGKTVILTYTGTLCHKK